MNRPSIVLVAVSLVGAALLGAPPVHAQPQQPTSPPPPPPPSSGQGYYGSPPPYAAQPEPVFERSGWFAGFGLQVGALSVNEDQESYGGGGLSGYFGGMVSGNVGLLFGLDISAYDLTEDEYYYEDDVGLSLATFLLGAQFWAGDKLWIRGAFGSTHASVLSNGETLAEDEGRSFQVGIGYEALQRTSFAMDINFTLMATSYGDNGGDTTAVGLGLGFGWY